MTCVILFWIACFELVLLWWSFRRTFFYRQLSRDLETVGRRVQGRADDWKQKYEQLRKENPQP